MFATVSVAVPTPVMCELLMYLQRTGNVQQPDEAIAAAIQQWLATMQAFPQQAAPGVPLRGYQWKTLFLPDGTRLRMQYRGDHEYANVEGDRLTYRGRAELAASVEQPPPPPAAARPVTTLPAETVTIPQHPRATLPAKPAGTCPSGAGIATAWKT